MKAIIASALVAATAFAGAASAQQVAPGALGAIAHFNESRQGGDVVSIRAASDAAISTRSDAATGAFARFNADADSQDGIRGVNGGTLYNNAPAYGADIFASLNAASLEDE